MSAPPVPLPTLRRLPRYYQYLARLKNAGQDQVSAAHMAEVLGVHHTQVRKDLAMTGCQDTMLPSARLPMIIRGIGVDPAHLIEIDATRIMTEENSAILRREIEYRGLSVVIAKRECLEGLKMKKKKAAAGGAE